MLWILSLFFLGVVGASQLTQSYDHTEVLESKYTIHWRVQDDEIYIGVEVGTTGWVGFGLAEESSGSMPGSDVFTAWVDDEGEAHLQDRHAMQTALPPIDDCNDWVLVNGKEVDGVTTIEVHRKLDTGDTQDRVIEKPTSFQLEQGIPVFTRIVYAFGLSDTVQYHESNRRATALDFFRSQEEDTSDGESDEETYTVEYRINNYELGTEETQYVCETFYLAQDAEHIVAIEAVLNPNSSAYVHHFGILKNPQNDSWVVNRLGKPDLCYNGEGGFPSVTTTIWGWGPGTPKLVLPRTAGMLTGSEGVFAVTLQVHYDNPDGVPGVVDNSGFKITYTKSLRQYNVGSLTIGDPFVSAPSIPPGEEHYGFQFDCPSNCTNMWSSDIEVFAAWMHMHQAGAQAVTTLHRQGSEDFEYFSRVDFWDFDFQQTVALPQPVTIHRGDKLNVHCYYNTLGRSQPTPMAAGSRDEMCVQILYYYPPIDFDNCGYFRDEENNPNETATLCGGRGDVISVPNPGAPDPQGVSDVIFGLEPEECDLATEDASSEEVRESSACILTPCFFLVGLLMAV